MVIDLEKEHHYKTSVILKSLFKIMGVLFYYSERSFFGIFLFFLTMRKKIKKYQKM